MKKMLPQQELLLQTLVMAGDIAVRTDIDGTLMARTLDECKAAGWIETKLFGAGFNKVTITPAGREQIGPTLPAR